MLLFLLILVFIAIAVGLVWFLLAHDHGEKEPVGMLWVALFLGALAGVAASWLEGALVDTAHFLPGASTSGLIVTMLTIGVVEEACKFIPLALIIYRKHYFNEHTDGIIYFALAGLGFGLPENIMYTVQYGTKTGMVRLLLTPLFHAALTAIVGYFLIRCKLDKKSPLRVVPILVGAMLLHALYDFGLTVGSNVWTGLAMLVTLSISAAMFVLYVRATELDQDRGLSAVGHNAFCRSCGHPNPKHHLYCTSCGKNA